MITLSIAAALTIGMIETRSPSATPSRPAPPMATEQAVPARCARPRGRQFRMFEALSYANKPDLSAWGFEPIRVVDRDIWAPGVSRQGAPSLAAVRALVKRMPDDGAPIVLDFEDYPLVGSDAQVADTRVRLGRILDAFRKAAPNRKLGFYSTLPTRDYWRAIKGRGTPEYRAWQVQSDRLGALEPKVDYLFPSVYTIYENRAEWRRYAIEQICEARRMSSKPVYMFLWPEYESGNNPFTPVEGDYWRMELELASELADGIVIWGGYDLRNNRGGVWDPDAEWWRETKRFVSSGRRSR